MRPPAQLPVRYRDDDGQALISVTQVLTLAAEIDDRWFTEEAAWRGSEVHRLTEVFDRGEKLIIAPGLHGYLDAYAEFLAVVRPTYAASEVKAVKQRLGLGGRIDRVCADFWGTPALLDFKTGDEQDWHGQQLAAYNVLRPTGARYCVHLDEWGGYRVRMHSDPADHRRFMYNLARVRGTVTAAGDYWIAA